MILWVKKGTFSDFCLGLRYNFRVFLPTQSKKGLPLRVIQRNKSNTNQKQMEHGLFWIASLIARNDAKRQNGQQLNN